MRIQRIAGTSQGAMKPGRETMQMKKGKRRADRIWQAGLAFALLLLLCGCTKKEELLLLNEENAAEGQPALQGDAVGQTAFTGDTEKTVASGQEASAQGVWAGKDQRAVDGGNRGAGMSSTSDLAQADAAPIQPGVIYVHVCGAVVSPGVYELETGSRVYEAVQRAGGFTENAEQNYVNQAQVLEDGVKLVIPTREEAAAVEERETAFASEKAQEGVSDQPQDGAGKEIGIVGGTAPEGQGRDTDGVQDGRVNINTASAAQLCEIPGVGATRAAAIISYRESHGAFEKPEDIMKVNGIKEGMYEKIKDSISVN